MRTLDSTPNNLPVELTSFIGRRSECAAVQRLIEANRLVTLTGAGGCGKTRLSQRAAAEAGDAFDDGVWWVDLARLSQEAFVANAIAAALAIKEAPGQQLIETLKTHLAGQDVLLVLDNCEHVVSACATLVHDLLHACPSLSILTTSREPLGVEGELVWRVPSMQVPDAGSAMTTDAMMDSEAVRLFIDRAARVRTDFRLSAENADAVAEISRRLDGIPLAIELAAARMRMMTPQQIVVGLEDQFRLLSGATRTAVPRHQTLRASVDWSYDLLDDQERAVLRRLSVFAGGATLEAVEAVCSDDDKIPRNAVLDIVAGLVDRSLVHVTEGGTSARYIVLETIRQYGRERLIESGEDDIVRDRHLQFFHALSEAAEPAMEGSGLFDWVSLLDIEYDNIRSAFDRAAESGATDECLRFAAALWQFWMVRGHLTEGRDRSETALSARGGDPRLRAEVLVGVGQIMSYYGDLAATGRFAQEAVDIARSLGDRRLEGRALDTLALSMTFLDPHSAPPVYREAASLLRAAGDRLFLADTLNGLGMSYFFVGDYPNASEALEEGVAYSREVGNPSILTIGLGVLGFTRGLRGRLPEAGACLRESHALARRLGDRVFIAQALYGLGFLDALSGAYERAATHLEESVKLGREVSPMILAFALCVQGVSRYANADLEGAWSSLEEALTLSEDMPVPWLRAWTFGVGGNVARARGDLSTARARIDEGLAAGRSGGMNFDLTIDADARVARASGEPGRAESLHHEALNAALTTDSVLLVPMQLEALAGLAALTESSTEAARLFGAAESARRTHGLSRYPIDAPGYQADVALARDALPDGDFQTAWDQGRAMSLEEAIAYARRGRGDRKRPSSGWASLTPTEVEVVRLVAEGLTNPQVAERLFVSRSTVKVHLSHVFAKLGVSTRAELAAAATRRDL